MNPTKEAENAWDVASRAKAQLEALGYKVLLTKENVAGTKNGKPNTNLKQRADVGNDNNAAVGISIHTSEGSVHSADLNLVPIKGDYVKNNKGKQLEYNNDALIKKDREMADVFAK